MRLNEQRIDFLHYHLTLLYAARISGQWKGAESEWIEGRKDGCEQGRHRVQAIPYPDGRASDEDEQCNEEADDTHSGRPFGFLLRSEWKVVALPGTVG